MRARFIVYATASAPDPPPPPPDPSIAEAQARREGIALSQAHARRSAKYGISSTDLKAGSARPNTNPSSVPGATDAGDIITWEPNKPMTEQQFGMGSDAYRTEYLPNFDYGKPPEGYTRIGNTNQYQKNLTPEQIAARTDKSKAASSEQFMARRNARLGVSSSLK